MSKRLLFYISVGIAGLFHLILFYKGWMDEERMLVHDSFDYLHYFTRIEDWIGRAPDVTRTPGYPMFAWIFHWPFLITLAQVGLLALNAWMLYKISNKHLSEIWSLVVVFLYLIDIPSIVNAHLILTETMTTSLLLWILLWIDKEDERKQWILGGLMGLLVLTRPSMIFVIPILWIYMISILQYWKIAILRSCVFACLFIGTFMFSNYLKHDQFFISKIGHFNLAYYWAPETLAMHDNGSFILSASESNIQTHRDNVWEGVLDQVEKPDDNYIQYYDALRSDALDSLGAHPITSMKVILSSFIKTGVKPDRGYLNHVFGNEKMKEITMKDLSFITLYQIGLNAIIALLLIFSMAQLIQMMNVQLILLFLLILLLLLLNPAYATDARFRIPAQPMIYLMAMIGLRSLLLWLKVKLKVVRSV